MFKKVFSLFILICLMLIFSYFKKDVFLENYKHNESYEKELILLKKNLNNFNLLKIKELEQISFYYTPYKDLLSKMIEKIDKSKKKIFLEMYMFTENERLPKALIRARTRGVQVKIILEKNPYKALNINNKTFDYLKKNNIDITWSNSENYSLNHTKVFIIDNDIILSTGNLTYSSFSFNRDFFLFIRDKKLRSSLEKIFLSDFVGNKIALYSDNLVLSPEYSKSKFKFMFNSAKKSIKMYFQYLKEEELENILLKKAKNIDIKVIVSKNFYDKNKDKINYLEKNNIKIVALKNFKMHAKAILIDDKFLFIGSENFSEYSLEKNREIGIILKDKHIIKKFIGLFKKDFENNK